MICFLVATYSNAIRINAYNKQRLSFKSKIKAKMFKQHPAGIGQHRHEKLKKNLPE